MGVYVNINSLGIHGDTPEFEPQHFDLLNSDTDSLRQLYYEIKCELGQRKRAKKEEELFKKYGKRNVQRFNKLSKCTTFKHEDALYEFRWVSGLEVDMKRNGLHISNRHKIPQAVQEHRQVLNDQIQMLDNKLFDKLVSVNSTKKVDEYNDVVCGAYEDLTEFYQADLGSWW